MVNPPTKITIPLQSDQEMVPGGKAGAVYFDKNLGKLSPVLLATNACSANLKNRVGLGKYAADLQRLKCVEMWAEKVHSKEYAGFNRVTATRRAAFHTTAKQLWCRESHRGMWEKTVDDVDPPPEPALTTHSVLMALSGPPGSSPTVQRVVKQLNQKLKAIGYASMIQGVSVARWSRAPNMECAVNSAFRIGQTKKGVLVCADSVSEGQKMVDEAILYAALNTLETGETIVFCCVLGVKRGSMRDSDAIPLLVGNRFTVTMTKEMAVRVFDKAVRVFPTPVYMWDPIGPKPDPGYGFGDNVLMSGVAVYEAASKPVFSNQYDVTVEVVGGWAWMAVYTWSNSAMTVYAAS